MYNLYLDRSLVFISLSHAPTPQKQRLDKFCILHKHKLNSHF
uniref:Uncharacterized protein n=1 Tax=Rhizophora mucronata TaxID=61149 RepID=A0A2P2NPL1_RHIMU